jgi:cysteine synthase
MGACTPTGIPSDRSLASLSCLVGKTPLLAIRCGFRGGVYTVFAKYELLNFTGSIKDRMALAILEHGYSKGFLGPDTVIAEATSGNTGISFAALGRALGHRVRIFMPDWMSQERVTLLGSFGAELVPVSKNEGGFLGSIQMARDFAAAEGNVFLPEQFGNQANVDAHEHTTGPEILSQLSALGCAPTGFVAGVGTGGTVMGVGKFLKAHVPGVNIHPLEPADSPTLRTGHKIGKHRIQGISDEFIPEIVKLSELDEIIDVRDGDAILMAQQLAHELGLAVGISSGANFLGALQVAERQGQGAIVATVFADSNKKYLSTDYASVEPVLAGDLTPDVQLLGFRSIPAA